MIRRSFLIVIAIAASAVCFVGAIGAPAVVRVADGGKVYTVEKDDLGPVYRVDMKKVKSAADLKSVPGVKIAWDLHPGTGSWLGKAGDFDNDGKIELLAGVGDKNARRIVRFGHDGRRVWSSEKINGGLGGESGVAVRDLDRDGKNEVIFNVYRQLFCLDAGSGKTKWKIDLPHCRDNYQMSVVGRFGDRKKLRVVCRVAGDMTCYDHAGKKVWEYRIDHKNFYGHDMVSFDADGDGLDEIYLSLKGKFLAISGDGKLLWSDDKCPNHSDFILLGDIDGDGDKEVVYDRDGCTAKRGPIVCVNAKGKVVRTWLYARPGKDHLQRGTLGDFVPSRKGLELAAVGKKRGMGGLVLWGAAGGPIWSKDIPAAWITCGDWDGDKTTDMMVTMEGGWQVWTGAGKRKYAISGIVGIPLDIESAGRQRPDMDANGKADVLIWASERYLVLMEAQ
jgi:outer membrane protein assembly factor BamB